mgnify:CR=1 FL=1
MSDRNEKTSAKIAALAARALSNPDSVTPEEVRSLAASALTQAADRPVEDEPAPDD